VNWRSALGDHTGYWSSQDDFVGRVANILAQASHTPIYQSLDGEWLKVSVDRRRWRVTWLSRSRAVTSLAVLAILFWPRSLLEPFARHLRELTAAAAATLPEKLAGWMPDAALVPDRLLGASELALATYLMFLVASAGWTLWERQELTRFFRREPHPSMGVAEWVFALGWVGVLVSAPAYALVHAQSGWGDILAILLVRSHWPSGAHGWCANQAAAPECRWTGPGWRWHARKKS